MVPLLMTRPMEAARRFVAGLPDDLRAALQVTHAPLMEIRPRTVSLDASSFRGVIFTSAHAVAIASRETAARRPAFCVGPHTTAVARQAGWQAECVGACAEELIVTLLSQRPPAPLLHLRGAHGRGAVAERLSGAGLPCEEQVVYDQALLPLSEAARRLIAGPTGVIVPLFSPRTARHFASQCGDAGNLHLVALSKAVAEPLECLNFKTLRVSGAADSKAMTQAVRDAADAVSRLEGSEGAE